MPSVFCAVDESLPITSSEDLPRHAVGRKATWFELFFDLAFVVAVAQL